MTFLAETILITAILLSVVTLASSRVGMSIRAFAVQSFLIAFLPWLLHEGPPGPHQIAVIAGTLTVKAFLIPWFLFRAIRGVAIRRDVGVLVGYGTSLFLAAVLVALAFAISATLPLPTGIGSVLLMPASLSTLLLGLLILITRTKAVTQVVGYLFVENGIYLFGVSLVTDMPVLVETGILLDVFVGVFVMGIVMFRINREFDHLDTQNLTALKD
jgi:hydrogenase-4 component E